MENPSNIHLIAGVSGSGKTSVGQALAQRLAVPFFDADAFHPQANLTKMEQGHPLTDADRWPWLQALNTHLRQQTNTGCVLACSALKESYRQVLAEGLGNEVLWVFLTGTFELIHTRMQQRNHFMPPALLQSQFDAWETPPYGLQLDVAETVESLVNQIIAHG
ncbi:MAG TPA: gluconate kinase [Cytophagales bacterium]|nr:gluconate kinase [Cytophagales bacterium]HAA23951.1 gluconate kinase [Cytophagales bacterium]